MNTKPYWKTEDPTAITPEHLLEAIGAGFPTNADPNAYRAFADWWEYIPEETMTQAMRREPETIFEPMAHVEGPAQALHFYQDNIETSLKDDALRKENEQLRKDLRTLRDDLAYASRSSSMWHTEHINELHKRQQADKQLETSRLEVLRLKAELYDLLRERREGA